MHSGHYDNKGKGNIEKRPPQFLNTQSVIINLVVMPKQHFKS